MAQFSTHNNQHSRSVELNLQKMSKLVSMVDTLNVNKQFLSSFIQFLDNDVPVGLVSPMFCKLLTAQLDGIFEYASSTNSIQFNRKLRCASKEEKTSHLNIVNQKLMENGVISGWRNEMFPVAPTYTNIDDEIHFQLERAAYPFYGIKAYGIHVNGFVRDADTGQISGLWIAQRSKTKSTWPGCYDHIVAGAQPFGLSIIENVVKECAEEANIPAELARRAVPVSAIAYTALETDAKFAESAQYMLRRDNIFCFDLEVPIDFTPSPVDGEVEGFNLRTVDWVLNTILDGDNSNGDNVVFKPNCCLVLIDFLIR